MESKEKSSVKEQGMVSSFFVSLRINFDKCNNCGKCVQVCMPEVLIMVNNQLDIVDIERCDGCAKCLNICPRRAISINQ